MFCLNNFEMFLFLISRFLTFWVGVGRSNFRWSNLKVKNFCNFDKKIEFRRLKVLFFNFEQKIKSAAQSFDLLKNMKKRTFDLWSIAKKFKSCEKEDFLSILWNSTVWSFPGIFPSKFGLYFVKWNEIIILFVFKNSLQRVYILVE